MIQGYEPMTLGHNKEVIVKLKDSVRPLKAGSRALLEILDSQLPSMDFVSSNGAQSVLHLALKL